MEKIGEKLRSWRQAAGLNQADVASYVGVTSSAVGHWECGRREPSGPSRNMLVILTAQDPTQLKNAVEATK